MVMLPVCGKQSLHTYMLPYTTLFWWEDLYATLTPGVCRWLRLTRRWGLFLVDLQRNSRVVSACRGRGWAYNLNPPVSATSLQGHHGARSFYIHTVGFCPATGTYWAPGFPSRIKRPPTVTFDPRLRFPALGRN